MRMLMNNLDGEVAERPQDLVVYGGTGRAARSWEAYHAIVATLKKLGDDETLVVQSAKPVGAFKAGTGPPVRRHDCGYHRRGNSRNCLPNYPRGLSVTSELGIEVHRPRPRKTAPFPDPIRFQGFYSFGRLDGKSESELTHTRCGRPGTDLRFLLDAANIH